MNPRVHRLKQRINRLTPPVALNWYRSGRDQVRRFRGEDVLVTRSRTNIDIVASRSDARTWLSRTPPTIRVVEPTPRAAGTANVVSIGKTQDLEAQAGAIGWEGTAAVVAADIHLSNRRNRDKTPRLDPTGLIVDQNVASELGIIATDGSDGALRRIVDAGYRIRVLPNTPPRAARKTGKPIGEKPVVVFAAIPMHDVGGGSRGAQIALELVRRGHHVTYVNRYESHEDVDLGLRFIHPGLEQVSLDRFDAGMLADRAKAPGLAIVELPDPALSKPIATLIARQWSMVFDLIDDWSDPALGDPWYSPDFEKDLIASAAVVSASAPDLLMRFVDTGRDDGVLIPNAVNDTIFSMGTVARPDDLPAGHVIGYHGSLYGNWIDWDGITRIANRFPDHSVVLIGEGRGVPKGLPDNVYVLGMKPQGELPAYVKHFDVAIVPFVVSDMTHAVSPLKVYEYLACGVPVAAPPLRSLDGLTGVHTDDDLVTAVERASTAARPNPHDALREHSWTRRMADLLPHVGWTLDTATDEPATIAYRTPVIYPKRQRLVSQPE